MEPEQGPGGVAAEVLLITSIQPQRNHLSFTLQTSDDNRVK